ncbi:hypothetical protein HAX54_027591, partial [Datura stramonium]|nr:hypothetical protein [Datura stramonium]
GGREGEGEQFGSHRRRRWNNDERGRRETRERRRGFRRKVVEVLRGCFSVVHGGDEKERLKDEAAGAWFGEEEDCAVVIMEDLVVLRRCSWRRKGETGLVRLVVVFRRRRSSG